MTTNQTKPNPIQLLKEHELPKPIENGQVSISNVAVIRSFLLNIVANYRDKDAATVAKLETQESKEIATDMYESLKDQVLGHDDDIVLISAHRMLKAFVAELAEYLPAIILRHQHEFKSETNNNRQKDAAIYESLKELVMSLVANAETVTRIETFDTDTSLSEMFPELAPFNPKDSKRAPGQMTWPNFTANETYGRSHAFVKKLAWKVDGENLPLKSTPNDVLVKLWPERKTRPTTGELYDMFGNVANVLAKKVVTFTTDTGHVVEVSAMTVE